MSLLCVRGEWGRWRSRSRGCRWVPPAGGGHPAHPSGCPASNGGRGVWRSRGDPQRDPRRDGQVPQHLPPKLVFAPVRCSRWEHSREVSGLRGAFRVLFLIDGSHSSRHPGCLSAEPPSGREAVKAALSLAPSGGRAPPNPTGLAEGEDSFWGEERPRGRRGSSRCDAEEPGANTWERGGAVFEFRSSFVHESKRCR